MTDEPWLKIAALQSAVRYGGSSLKSIPELIVSVCAADPPLWKEFTPPGLDEPVVHKSFDSFITANPPNGLGATRTMIENIVKDDSRASTAVREASKLKTGRKPKEPEQPEADVDTTEECPINNRTLGRRSYTTRAAIMERLQNDFSELHEAVERGELSASAAGVKAGFVPRKFSILADPESAARTIKKQLTPEQIAQLKELL